jgi:hypothetical protein
MTDPQTIASKLTKAQRAAVMRASRATLESLSPRWMKARPNTCEALADKGIFRHGSARWTGTTQYALTELGLAVRTHLEKEPKK